jgi:hypothetical protein
MATEAVQIGTIHKNLIDGEWVESRSGQTFENLNPADTREVVGVFQQSGREDVEAAVEAAKRAFEKWRLVPAPRRAEIIYKASQILEQRKESHARDGQSYQGNARRRAGGHRYRLFHGRRRPPHVRHDHTIGAAKQVRHVREAAARRRRHDYAVEFPHGNSVMEAVSRARRW